MQEVENGNKIIRLWKEKYRDRWVARREKKSSNKDADSTIKGIRERWIDK